jgi:hypothetical protein
MSMDLYMALLHYPVYNRTGRVIATAVTNVDVHDMSRVGATYDVKGVFLVTPVEQQRVLIGEMIDHWTSGLGASYNPRRKEAIERSRVVRDLEEAIKHVIEKSGTTPLLIGTGANVQERMVSFSGMRTILESRTGSAMVIFGTGWGLERSFMESFDYVLAPVLGPGEYNHLSVRSAAAIILDRLCGRRVEE